MVKIDTFTVTLVLSVGFVIYKVVTKKREYKRLDRGNVGKKERTEQDYLVPTSPMYPKYFSRMLLNGDLNENDDIINEMNNEISLGNKYLRNAFECNNHELIEIELNKALQKYTETLALNKHNYQVLRYRSEVYLHLKKYNNALNDITKCITYSPEWIDAHYFRGVILCCLGELGMATKEFEYCMNLCSETSDQKFKKPYIMWSHAISVRGQIYMKNKNYLESVRLFSKVIALNPNWGQIIKIYGNRCMCYIMLKRYIPALDDSKRIIHLDNKWFYGYYLRGIILCQLKIFNDGIKYLNIAIDKCDKHLQMKRIKQIQFIINNIKNKIKLINNDIKIHDNNDNSANISDNNDNKIMIPYRNAFENSKFSRVLTDSPQLPKLGSDKLVKY